ncbi:MAG: hypothetical protein ACFCUI_12760 [Bernardetiaceae bacterium]
MVVAYSYFTFHFRFLDADARPCHRRRYTGVVGNEGIELKGAMLYYEDIADIRWENDQQIVLLLMPYITTGAVVTEHILPNSYALVLDTRESELSNLKMTLNKYFTYAKAERNRRALSLAGKADTFYTKSCPACASTIDLSGLPKTKYIYCRYCETISSNMGNIIPHTELYRPCPDCQYFGHVQVFRDVQWYFYGKDKRAAHVHNVTCCDTCAQDTYFKPNVWRNLGYLLAFPFSVYLRLHSTLGQHPDFTLLTEANRLAHSGDPEGAIALYDHILMQYKYHPGILYNKARAYVMAADGLSSNDAKTLHTQAAEQLSICLQACANYQPALDLIYQYEEAAYYDFPIQKVEVEVHKKSYKDLQ